MTPTGSHGPHRLTAGTFLGRGQARAGLPDEPWVPRRLVVLTPYAEGSLATVERGPVRVRGPRMQGTVEEGVQLALGSGSHRLDWLGLLHEIGVVVDIAEQDRRREEARSEARRRQVGTTGTLVPRERGHVLEDERTRLAVAFRHLLTQEPRHKDHWALAAEHLGLTAEQLRAWVHKRKERLQRQLLKDGKRISFTELDDYGLWLVTRRMITVDDLPPAAGDGYAVSHPDSLRRAPGFAWASPTEEEP